MSATANALNEIKVLIPKKLASEVTDASKNKVFEFLTGEWADSSETTDNDATFVLKIDDIRQLELETSPRHSKVSNYNYEIRISVIILVDDASWRQRLVCRCWIVESAPGWRLGRRRC